MNSLRDKSHQNILLETQYSRIAVACRCVVSSESVLFLAFMKGTEY